MFVQSPLGGYAQVGHVKHALLSCFSFTHGLGQQQADQHDLGSLDADQHEISGQKLTLDAVGEDFSIWLMHSSNVASVGLS